MKKVAILIDLLVPGGVQKAAIEEMHCLNKAGYHTQLFCLAKTSYDYQYEDLLKGLSIRYLSDLNPYLFKKTIKLPFFAFLTSNHLLNPLFARRYKELKQFDLIISHGTTTCFTTLAIKKAFGIPYIAFIWDPMGFILEKVYKGFGYLHPFFKKIISYLEYQIVKNAVVVVTPSNVHKKTLEKSYGIKPVTIYPGYDFSEKFKPAAKTYILGYTRWQKEKYPDFFLTLAQKISTPIILAGVWTDRNQLKTFKEKVKQNKLNISIIETVKHQDIGNLAKGAIAWVHPNYESFGMVGLEMAYHGVPIIIPRGSGVTEIFQDKVHGFFPKDNEKDLVFAVNKLINNPSLAVKMGEKARKMAKRYTWKTHTLKLAKEINGLFHKPLSVTLIHNGFASSKSIAGGDQVIFELSKHLHGINLSIITPLIGFNHWKKQVANTKINYQILSTTIFDNRDSPIALFMTYLIRSVQSILILRKIKNPDILISNSELTPDILPGWWFRMFHSNIPWVTRIHHLFPHPYKREGRLLINLVSWFLQRFSIFLMHFASIVLVDNQEIVAGLISLGISKKNIKLHYLGVDYKQISLYKAHVSQIFTAACVGRLSYHKGVFDLVPIWTKVVKSIPEATLAVIGEGPETIKKRLVSQINSAHLQKNIKLLGFLPRFSSHQKGNSLSLFGVLKNCQILLFPDHEAGFGLVVAEAMACGLPVVAYNLPIFGTIYKKGFLTSPFANTNNFALQIIKLLRNQKLYQQLSQQAVEQAAQHDWNKAANRFGQLLENLDND